MKKLISLLLLSGGYMAVTAQAPDTTRQLNNAVPPDSTSFTQPVTPVENPPAITTQDTLQMAPNLPVSTNTEKSQPMADSMSMQRTNVPAGSDTNTAIAPVITVTSGDSSLNTNTPAMPASEKVRMQTNLPDNSNTNYVLPRGVNNPDITVSLTGLNKWSSLPILNTYVPQEVVDKLKTEHGDKLYDITTLKTGENQYAYSARIQENGVYNTVLIK